MKTIYIAAGAALLVLAGCVSPDTTKPVSLPWDSTVIGVGSPDALILPANKAGTIFFTDDQTGQVVWATTIPLLDDPRPAFDQHNMPRGFQPDRKYRMYYSLNLSPGEAYTEFQ